MICWSIFDWFWVDLGVENRPKIDQKSIQKSIENKMQVGMDFGWLLDRFLTDFEPKLGVKLAPKSEEMGYQDDVKKSLKIWSRKWTHVVRSGPQIVLGPGP